MKKITNTKNGPLQKNWHDHGYDTAWVPRGINPSGMEEDCVWDPERIEVVNIEFLRKNNKI